MPRDNISGVSLNALLAQQTSEAFIVLLTVTDQYDNINRFTNDSTDRIGSGTIFDWTSPTAWNSANEDPDGVWATNGDNTFNAATSGGEGRSNYVFSVFPAGTTDVFTDGQVYTCNFEISGLTGQGNIRIWLGDSFSTVQPFAADGAYSVDIVAGFTPTNDLIRIEETCADGGSYLLTLVNFTQYGDATYYQLPFDVILPSNVDGQSQMASISMENVSRDLIDEIRSQTKPLTMDIQVVRGSDPTDIIASFPQFKLRQVSYNVNSLSGQLSQESFMNEMVGALMTGSNFPGLFYV